MTNHASLHPTNPLFYLQLLDLCAAHGEGRKEELAEALQQAVVYATGGRRLVAWMLSVVSQTSTLLVMVAPPHVIHVLLCRAAPAGQVPYRCRAFTSAFPCLMCRAAPAGQRAHAGGQACQAGGVGAGAPRGGEAPGKL